jgi:pseudouridine-5'-monophosphatase
MIFSRPIRAVLFDMDGILLDTERIYTEVTQEYVGQWGKTFDWSVKANMVGRPAIEAATYLVEALKLPVAPEDYLKDRESHLLERMGDAQPMPGAEKLVGALQSAGVPITVATSSNRTFFARKTAHNTWFSLFDAIITGDDERIGRGKPAPDIFLLAAEAIGVPAADCLVVEDSPAGVAAGNAAGAQTLAVPFPGMDHSKLSDADRLVTSLADVSLADLGL